MTFFQRSRRLLEPSTIEPIFFFGDNSWNVRDVISFCHLFKPYQPRQVARRVRAAAGAKRPWQRSTKPFALASAQSPPHQSDAPRQKHSSGQRCHPELELKSFEMRAYTPHGIIVFQKKADAWRWCAKVTQ